MPLVVKASGIAHVGATGGAAPTTTAHQWSVCPSAAWNMACSSILVALFAGSAKLTTNSYARLTKPLSKHHELTQKTQNVRWSENPASHAARLPSKERAKEWAYFEENFSEAYPQRKQALKFATPGNFISWDATYESIHNDNTYCVFQNVDTANPGTGSQKHTKKVSMRVAPSAQRSKIQISFLLRAPNCLRQIGTAPCDRNEAAGHSRHTDGNV